MPHGAPPPPPPSSSDPPGLVVIPPRLLRETQTGVVNQSLAAGASVPIPGIREDLGLVEVIVGTDVAGFLSVDGIPIRTPASASVHLPLGEPGPTGQPHSVTNIGGATVFLSLFAVARQERLSDNAYDPLSPAPDDVSPQATD